MWKKCKKNDGNAENEDLSRLDLRPTQLIGPFLVQPKEKIKQTKKT